eukprot:9569261-Karenia_brevis.AAC.1
MDQLHGDAGGAKNMAERVEAGVALASALGYNNENHCNGPGSAPGVAQTIGAKSNFSPFHDDRVARLELLSKS